MDTLALAFGTVGSVTTGLHLASLGLAWSKSRRGRRGETKSRLGTPPVTILRPVCGLENRLDETLGSTFHLDYPTYEVIFCVAREDDPVVPLVRRLIAANPQVPAQLLVGNERPSGNPKLDNLFKGWDAARHDWVVMADSNVLMPKDYLQQLMANWGERTGLVCSPPVGTDPIGFWAEFECAFLNSHAARWQLASDALGFGFAQGKSMFWRKATIDEAGGLMAIGREAAEDAASTKLIRSRGEVVSLVDNPFPQPLGRRGFREVWRRQERWARLRRVAFPAAYLPEILSGSLFSTMAFALTLVALGLDSVAVAAWTALYLTIWYAAEAAFTRAMGWPMSARSMAAFLLRDLMVPVLFVRGLGNGFEWRGNAMTAGTMPMPRAIAKPWRAVAARLSFGETGGR